MKKKLLTGLIISVSLAGCGGGGSSDAEESGGTSTGGTANGSGTNVKGIAPVTATKAKASYQYKIKDEQLTYTTETGYEGDIQAITKTQIYDGDKSYSFPKISLAASVPSLNVTDIQKTIAIDVSCSNGFKASGVEKSNFVTGEVVASGIYKGKSLSCRSKYTSPLPTTLTNSNLDELLEDWGDDTERDNAALSGLISTDCPQDDGDDDEDDFNPLVSVCHGSILSNYVVTSSSPAKVHKFFTKTTW